MKFDLCGSMHICVRGNFIMPTCTPPPKETCMHANAHLNTRFAVLLKAIENSHAHECMKGIVWITEISLYVRLLQWRLWR